MLQSVCVNYVIDVRSIAVRDTVLGEGGATRGGARATMHGQVPVLRRSGRGYGVQARMARERGVSQSND